MCFIIDCLGEMCPIPILKAEKKLENLKDGDSVGIMTDHSCTKTAVVNYFCKKKGYPCSVEEIDVGIWEIRIKKNN
ncbi:MAG: sulfurtransferase TusA family protein [Bacillota bacterium]|nr:sulfurtransferase TusA family protein [Bacillota bacterium]